MHVTLGKGNLFFKIVFLILFANSPICEHNKGTWKNWHNQRIMFNARLELEKDPNKPKWISALHFKCFAEYLL